MPLFRRGAPAKRGRASAQDGAPKDSSNHHGRGDARAREDDVPACSGNSSWEQYRSMSARRDDPFITYRAGRQTRSAGGAHPHPYGADERSSRQAGRPRAPADSYYALLGVDQRASEAAIEQAYRRHVVQVHPDRFFNDPARYAESLEKLRALNAAMMVLRDPVRRAEYDATLAGGLDGPPLTRRIRTTPRPHVM